MEEPSHALAARATYNAKLQNAQNAETNSPSHSNIPYDRERYFACTVKASPIDKKSTTAMSKQLRKPVNYLNAVARWSTAAKSRARRLFKTIHDGLKGLRDALYSFVLYSFKNINRKIKSRFPVWRMKEETAEHVGQSVKVFIWLILPLSLLYVFGQRLVFADNALGPMLWSIAIYFYSNFLPDLPSIHRKKKPEADTADLPWYKKYALLLFAPLLVWLLFSGIRLNWRTEETYHNFTALAVYGTFLFIVGFLAFAAFPVQIKDVTRMLFFPLCGITGFLAHLKVDEIW